MASIDLSRFMSKYLIETAGDLTEKQRDYIESLVEKIPPTVTSSDGAESVSRTRSQRTSFADDAAGQRPALATPLSGVDDAESAERTRSRRTSFVDDAEYNSTSDKQNDTDSRLLDSQTSTDRVTETIRRVLEDDHVTLDTLPKDQIGRLISLLQREAIASDKQIEMIYDRIVLTRIKEMLRRDVQLGDKLTIREVSFLLKNPNQFTFWSKEHPEKSFDRYEYGWQDSEYCEDSKMYYLKFFDLLMIDFDEVDLDEVRSRLIQTPQYSYALYKTYNGYHAFVVSRSIIHRGSEAQFILEKMGCDRYYMLFAKKAGFKVRLTPKKDRNESVVAEYLETIGTVDPYPECLEMIKIHDKYLGITRDY